LLQWLPADRINAAFEIAGLRQAPLAALRQCYISGCNESMSGHRRFAALRQMASD
jgi:hypothetical protein